jgi:hypothetical protein
LKQLWFYFCYAYMTQRVPNFEDKDEVPSLAVLASLDFYVKSFPLPKDVEKPPQFPGTDKARKWFEQFDQRASRYLGSSGVPLLYVIRKESKIEEEDKGWYQLSLNEDLALRGPHGNESMFWHEDNLAIWNMLMHCLHPTSSWTHIKPFQKKSDGHGAYTALKANMFGPEVTKTLRANAVKVISTIKYNGQSKGLSFDKMSTTLTQAFLNCVPSLGHHQWPLSTSTQAGHWR